MTSETEDSSRSDPEASSGLRVECKIHLKNGRRGKKEMRERKELRPPTDESGCIPRVTRLMALAIRFDNLVRSGEVRDYADLARLGHVSRARVTQIMNLLNLAPDIQEQILLLPRTLEGPDPITERQLRHLLVTSNWTIQRDMWEEFKKESGESG